MKHCKTLLLVGAHSLFCTGLCAQDVLPARPVNLLVASDTIRKLPTGGAGQQMIPVYGGSYTLSLNSDWLKAVKNDQGFQLYFPENDLAGERKARLTLQSDNGTEKTITVIQPGNESIQQAIPGWIRIFPTRAEANKAQSGTDIDKTQDGNTSTLYHSPWEESISEENPAILTYYFDEPVHLDMVTYVPRQSGGQNGNFGLVDVYFRQRGNQDFQLLGSYDFEMQNLQRTLSFGSEGLENIEAVQFVVKTGYSDSPNIPNFASCAEMEFKQKINPNSMYYNRIEGVTATNNGVAAQSGEGIERTLDKDRSTLFHTSYDQAVSAQNPAVLLYQIPEGKKVSRVTYVPRQNGQNGNFGQVKVEYRTEGQTEFTLLTERDFGKTSTPTTLDLPETEQPIRQVRFTVTSGQGNFASCAEMEFYETLQAADYTQIFADKLMTSLKEGITLNDINQLTDPLVKRLALDLLDGTYDTKYRVAEFPCLLSPHTLSAEWNTSGSKLYDQLQGVTGINISRGKNVVVVEGADPNVPLHLKVVAWYNGENRGPAEYSYTLGNGVNTFEYNEAYDGLAYISYYSEEDPEQYAPVKVHFPYGQVNGYLSPDKSNEEMHQLTANARNTCMDLVGEKVHSVWTAEGLHNYCKASDGESVGYRQYMNLLDTLVGWEQRLVGLEKYDRVPANKTMLHVNYMYYFYQGAYGPTFMYDTENRVLNCKTLMYNDGDAIWNMSHEWGHQHQMQPYFGWAGLGESSNNMNSCYNVLHMGYSKEYHAKRIQDAWTAVYNHQILGQTTTDENAYGDATMTYQYVGSGNGNYVKEGDSYTDVNWGEGDYVYETKKSGPGAVAESRNRAYDHIDAFDWCPPLQEAIRDQRERGYRIPDFDDKEHTVSTYELYEEENTAAFFMLHNYFSNRNHADYVPDFQEDLYEALRQNDLPNGSSIEKQGEADKYELLASAHNSNKEGKYDVFKARYPESCWITQGYLKIGGQSWTQNSVPFIFNYIRKASRLCGYNLFDYFDRMGFLRTIVLAIDDYGIKYYAMTDQMKEEFRRDMNQLGLKPMTEAMIQEITNSPIPTFQTPQIPN